MEISEDYVNYETAELLKEKGFPIEEFHKGLIGTFKGIAVSKITKEMIEKEILSCIPQSVVMKWLREVYNIHIIIHRYPVKLNYSDVKLWYSEIITLTSPESVDKQFFLNEENDTYEAACETAIKYCLTNLI